MARYITIGGTIAVLMIAASAGFMALLGQKTWEGRARTSLLANGHLFSRLESPTGRYREALGRSNEFISKIVLERQNIVGHLDRYGHFVALAQGTFDLEKENRVTGWLYVVQ